MTPNYNRLADLLEYPREHWSTQVAIARDSESLCEFTNGIEKLSLSDLQELYTRTFDLNPVCALEIGYHLFGENYKRGEFLANLRETEAPFDLGQENQLPDYLPVLLRLLTKLDDEQLRSSLMTECMVPALDKMLMSLTDTDNPYRFLLEALRTTIQSEVGVVSVETPRLNTRPSLPVLDQVSVASARELF
jgi:nitrate reductase molybdenum cofactor assembly chaperone